MAAQHFVAFSSVVDGAALIAGSPYGCGHLPDFNNACKRSLSLNSPIPPHVIDCSL